MSKHKVNVPGEVKVVAMLSSTRQGKKDGFYLRAMAEAIHEQQTKRQENLKKLNRDLSEIA